MSLKRGHLVDIFVKSQKYKEFSFEIRMYEKNSKIHPLGDGVWREGSYG